MLSKNKRPERVGKIQLIDASGIYHKLRKGLGNKKNEISRGSPAITKLYADFQPGELVKIIQIPSSSIGSMVMQLLQRSYAITEERIQKMLSDGALSGLYMSKVNELKTPKNRL